MTMIDLLTTPALVDEAWKYFREEQTKTVKYESLFAPADEPQTSLNAKRQGEYREQLKKFYYDASKYDTYLEQLGITYPTVRTPTEPKKP
jgi:aminobenzoyl-glutamate utilization protein B